MSEHDPNHKGNVAEAAIAAAAVKLGIGVMKPLVEHGRYDLVFDVAGRLLRVQCKWAPKRGDIVAVNLAAFRYTARGQVRSVYTADEIDAVAAYCEPLDTCYLLPAALVDRRRAIHLRLAPARNGQRAVNWASDYEIGAVAQLGERWYGIPEGVGSSPISSTSCSACADETVVGAHEFRNRFGWYMQRAAAGETFLVKRRGKPHVRLSSAAAGVVGGRSGVSA